MSWLLKQVVVNHPFSPYNGQIVDLLVENGKIVRIGKGIDAPAAVLLQGEQLYVSAGWVDVFANFADPGFEYKESIESGIRAAAAGGFTDVFLIPNTKPVVDTKSQVEYLLHKSRGHIVNVHPLGAVSNKTEGKDLAEMYDMKRSGARAFTDGLHPIQSSGLLLKALQYVKSFDGVILQIPDDRSLAPHGLMHEGLVSTRIGLAGKPMMAEELLVARDIELARYTNSALHFTGVTSPKSLEYIRNAKSDGLKITCSVTPYHLFFNDSALWNYETQFKVYPPIRTSREIDFLKKAVFDGTIDCFASHHMPHERDSKEVEFEYAANGMIGLESMYSALNKVLEGLPNNRWAELLGLNARKIFDLSIPNIEEGADACLTLYSPEGHYQFQENHIQSQSKNSAFLGQELKGKALAIFNNSKHQIN